ncbi:tyrosine-type recombinase/integrase [Candidatus Borreliella tachyglossi]|uniref:tyrosine-type recombinase/integrase n=1 Tax=Candidatus Borreliella tachyglossi TaxID=1964448 RepID=UPI0040424839
MSEEIPPNTQQKLPNSNSINYSNLNNIDEFLNSLAIAYKNNQINDTYIMDLSNIFSKKIYAKLLSLIMSKDNNVIIYDKDNSNLDKKKTVTKYRKKPTHRKTNFYMSITREQVLKILELAYERDKIMGLFYYLQYMTGARCCEIANIKLEDIRRVKIEDEYMYRINIHVAKKRDDIVIRPVLISIQDFKRIQEAHKTHAENKLKNKDLPKNYNYLKRTYLFQKTKYKRLSTNNMSFFLREIIRKVTRKKNVGKCSHIFRHYRIFLMKNRNIPSYEIKEEFHFSNISMVDRYGKPLVDKKKDYETMLNEKPAFAK